LGPTPVSWFRNREPCGVPAQALQLGVEAHLRALTEQGSEAAVINDATAGARHPKLCDGYEAALTNSG